MGAWLRRFFSWDGETSRDEYRRWLPAIVAIEGALLWSLFTFGERGQVNFNQFGWIGTPLFLIGLLYYIGWFLLTARRLRSAEISRGWMIPAFVAINLPVAGYHINVSMITALILTAVAAIARDRLAVPA